MKRIKLIVGFVALSACIATAQEMSNEWYQQKAASWARTTQDFPQSAYPGPFKTRMLEIEAWAKVNNQELYYNSSKPYLLARMVQDEIDAEAARRRQTQRPASASPVPKSYGNKSSAKSDLDRGNLSGSALGTIWLGSAVIVGVTFCVAYALYRIIRPRAETISATALGRKWSAWIVAISTISSLPSFFRKFDGNSIIQWIFVVLFFGVTSFVLGWLVGLIRYRNQGETQLDQTRRETMPTENDYQKADDGSCNNLPHEFRLEEEPPRLSSSLDQALNEKPNMTTNQYEVIIPEGTALDGGYVQMPHNTRYSLTLKNHRSVRCDAKVLIDGIHVGTWRVEIDDEIHIERPVHDRGYFTFFAVGTEEANMAGIERKSDNGLVSVTFTPERVRDVGVLCASPLPGDTQGATALTGESKQRFVDAEEIEHDTARAFTIHLRLIATKPDIRPLAPRSTPIPPPVG